MYIKSVYINHCRIIEQCSLELNPKCNVFIGDNGSGKSSLIEALSLLSKGRSFRSAKIQELIKKGQQKVQVAAQLYDEKLGEKKHLRLEKSNEKTEIRINKQASKKQSDLSACLPLTIIHPEIIFNLVSGSPQYRRSFIDWIAFYLYPEFHSTLQLYQNCLSQRNACLRDESNHYALNYFTEQIIPLIPKIEQFRNQALETLNKVLESISHQNKTFTHQIRIKINHGVPMNVNRNDEGLSQYYQSKIKTDLKFGNTQFGPHRCDLQIFLDEDPIHSFASRGQLKMTGIILLFAQSKVLEFFKKQKTVLAVDDLASEIDEQNQAIIKKMLLFTDSQLIFTSNTIADNAYLGSDVSTFYVKHGQFSLINKPSQ